MKKAILVFLFASSLAAQVQIGKNVQIGAGGGGGTLTGTGTPNFVPLWTSSTSLGNSHIDDGATTAATITITEPVVVNASGNGVTAAEGTAPSGVASSDVIYPDSTAHRWKMNNNNGGALNFVGIGTAATAGHAAVFASNGIDVVDGGTAPGTGTVTNFTAGNLSPLFTTSVATATSTPALSFSLSTAGAHSYLGNNTGSTAAPAYVQPAFTDLSGSLACSQRPALTGDTTASAGSCVTTVASVGGTAAATVKTRSFGTTFGDTGGSALTSGSVVYFTVPYACTIAAWNITVDAGTVTFDIWKIATGTAVPTVTNTITASALPALSTGTALHSTTLTGWTTSVAANDIFGIQLKTVATAKYAELDITCNQ